MVSPISGRNLDEEYLTLAYEEDCLKQKVAVYQHSDARSNETSSKNALGEISSL